MRDGGHRRGRAGVAAAVVPGETLVFAGNGFRCPLTGLAERYGAEHGSVTDIYLPKWLAHNMPAIHAPLLMLMAYLHARNLIRPRRALAATEGSLATGGPLSRCSGRCQTEPVRRTPHRQTDCRPRLIYRTRTAAGMALTDARASPRRTAPGSWTPPTSSCMVPSS
jgi:hypothetical protein